MTLSKNIGQAISDFTGIKNAIEANGVEVVQGTPTRDYPALIGQIETGADLPEFTGILTDSINKDDVALGVTVPGLENYPIKTPTTYTGRASFVEFSPDGHFFAVGLNAAPWLLLYKVQKGLFIQLPNPAVMPTYQVTGLKFNPNNDILVVGQSSTPYIHYYLISGDTFTHTNFGTTLKDVTGNIRFSPDGKLMTMAGYSYTGTGVDVYSIGSDRLATFLTNLNFPYAVSESAFSPDGRFLAQSLSNKIRIFTYSGNVFTNVAEIPDPPSIMRIVFSADSRFLAVISDTPVIAKRFLIYRIDGTKFTLLDNLPQISISTTLTDIAFSPDRQYIVITRTSGSPYIVIYKFDGTILKQINDPDVIPIASLNSVSFSGKGEFLAVAQSPTSGEAFIIYKGLPINYIIPSSETEIQSALEQAIPLISEGTVEAIGNSQDTANAGATITMNVWI